MKQLIIVRGLQRSGNHGIINWIRGHETIPFFNNLIPIVPILRGRRTIPPPRDFNTWLQAPESLAQLPAQTYRHIIVSIEDHELDVAPFCNVSWPILNVLILRDPYNLFASRIRRGSQDKQRRMPHYSRDWLLSFVGLWKRYAEEFLGLTNIFADKVCIDYNRWFASQAYRQQLSSRLGFQFSDINFAKVPHHGGGSSFDGFRYDGQNTEMAVLNRYDALSAEERQMLVQVARYDGVRELTEEIWGSDIYPDGLEKARWHPPSVRRVKQRAGLTNEIISKTITSDITNDITVVIPSCNRSDLLKRTLETLIPHILRHRIPVLIGENCCYHHKIIAAVEDIRNRYPAADIQLLDLTTNDTKSGTQHNMLRSVDALYDRVQTEYIFHSEDDWSYATQDFISASRSILQHHPEIKIVRLTGFDYRPLPDLASYATIRSGDNENLSFFYSNYGGPGGKYGAFTFHPGLRRKSDYWHCFRPYTSFADESDISAYGKILGHREAILEQTFAQHIGTQDSALHHYP